MKVKCPHAGCKGTGKIACNVGLPDEFIMTCPVCHGDGMVEEVEAKGWIRAVSDWCKCPGRLVSGPARHNRCGKCDKLIQAS